MIIEELITVLGFRQSGTAALENYKRGIASVTTGLNGLIATAGRAAAILGGLGVSLGGVALVKGVIDTGRQFEKFQAILETVEGSSEKARASLDWVSKFATQTPYELAEVTEAFVRMKAYGLDPTNGSLTSIGDAGSAMNKTIMQGVEALADATTGQFERLKEFGITSKTVGDQVTFFWTQNGVAMEKTIKKTQSEIATTIVDIFNKFEGAMKKRSATLDGIMANISDSWTRFEQKIGDAGFYQEIKRRTQGLLDIFNRLDADGSLDRWAAGISRALVGTMRLVERISTTIMWAARGAGQAIGYLTDRISALTGLSWGAILGTGGFALLVRRHPVVAFLMALLAVLDDLRVYMSGEGESVIGTLMAKFNEFAESFPGIAGAITEVGGALFYLVSAIVAFRLAVTGIKAAGAALASVFAFAGVGGAAAGAAAGGAGAGAVAVGAAGLSRWAALGSRAKAVLGVGARMSVLITAAMVAWRARAGLADALEEGLKGNIFGGMGSGGKGGFVDRFLYSIGEAAAGMIEETITGFFGSGTASGLIDGNAPGSGPRPRPPNVGGAGGSMEWMPGVGYVARPSGPSALGGATLDQVHGGISMWANAQAYGKAMAASLAASIGPVIASIMGSFSGPLQMLGGTMGLTASVAPPAPNISNVSVTVSAPVSITMTGTAATPGAVAGAVTGAITGAAGRAADILSSEPAADASPAVGAAGAAA